MGSVLPIDRLLNGHVVPIKERDWSIRYHPFAIAVPPEQPGKQCKRLAANERLVTQLLREYRETYLENVRMRALLVRIQSESSDLYFAKLSQEFIGGEDREPESSVARDEDEGDLD